ncbi:hypothetical protein F9278_36295 [Streptomyces phaeolivaceus]|uniref:Uncharacterized protein n=1 Tax=Streptomyces phaeolivaceus TaxID=2653200 RepID=A0A5P8KDM0_9ACTN|nr:hypothetical protein [Streptomyces phaeolivaceus]QFR00738.1 hypothetical protein F9278_36295 [Streptomyces phaeolivaceus]
MKPREDVAAMLRAGATQRQITAALGVQPRIIAATRQALGIPVPPGRGGRRRDAVRDQVADMLRTGATARQIRAALGVSTRIVTEVRKDRGIPIPAGRGGGRSPDPALHDRIAQLLHAGHTYDEIQAQTGGTSTATIAAVRKERRIPLPPGRHNHTGQPARTPEQALHHHSRPAPDDHTDWTGPTQGHSLPVLWSAGRHNALHIAFRLHHGRQPTGYVRRTCTHPGCITGAHLNDRRIRQANNRADQAYEQIFGATS